MYIRKISYSIYSKNINHYIFGYWELFVIVGEHRWSFKTQKQRRSILVIGKLRYRIQSFQKFPFFSFFLPEEPLNRTPIPFPLTSSKKPISSATVAANKKSLSQNAKILSVVLPLKEDSLPSIYSQPQLFLRNPILRAVFFNLQGLNLDSCILGFLFSICLLLGEETGSRRICVELLVTYSKK